MREAENGRLSLSLALQYRRQAPHFPGSRQVGRVCSHLESPSKSIGGSSGSGESLGNPRLQPGVGGEQGSGK